MNKQQLIYAVSAGCGMNKVVVETVLDQLALTTAEELTTGTGEVTLPGIGRLRLDERAARTGRNPQSGAPVEIPARTVVKFAATKTLREAVA